MKIVMITDNILKQEITNNILGSLPNWFAVEESIVEYSNTLDDKDFIAIKEKEEFVGFYAINYINSDVANLYILAVKQEYHNKGIGTLLYDEVESYLRKKGYKYITIYTLSSKSTDEYYERTRNFYHKIGFTEAYENEKIWNEKNPFLLMIKYIS